MNTGMVSLSARMTAAKPVPALVVTAAMVVLGAATPAMAAGSEAMVIEGPGLDGPLAIDFRSRPDVNPVRTCPPVGRKIQLTRRGRRSASTRSPHGRPRAQVDGSSA